MARLYLGRKKAQPVLETLHQPLPVLNGKTGLLGPQALVQGASRTCKLGYSGKKDWWTAANPIHEKLLPVHGQPRILTMNPVHHQATIKHQDTAGG